MYVKNLNTNCLQTLNALSLKKKHFNLKTQVLKFELRKYYAWSLLS